MLPPTFRVGLPSSINLIETVPQRHTPRLVPSMILGPNEVAITINHHRCPTASQFKECGQSLDDLMISTLLVQNFCLSNTKVVLPCLRRGSRSQGELSRNCSQLSPLPELQPHRDSIIWFAEYELTKHQPNLFTQLGQKQILVSEREELRMLFEVHKLSVLQFLLPCGALDGLSFLGTAGCEHKAFKFTAPTGHPSFLVLCYLPRVTTKLHVQLQSHLNGYPQTE